MKKILSLLFIVASLQSVQAQIYPIYQKTFNKIEQLYRLGKYTNAINKSNKLDAKLLGSRKVSTEQAQDLKVINTILKARSEEARGHYKEMETAIAKAQSDLNKMKSSEGKMLAYTLIASVYLEYGNPLKAKDILSKVKPQAISNELVKGDYMYEQGLMFMQIGEYNEAQKISEELLKLREAQSDGPQKLKGSLKRVAKDRLAAAIILHNRIISNKGDYHQADSLFKKNKKRVRRLVGFKDYRYISYLLAMAENYDNQGKTLKASNHYNMAKRANEYYDDTFRESSKMYLHLQESITRNTLQGSNFIAKTVQATRLKRNAKEYYGRNSLPYLRALIVNAERYASNRKFDKAEEELTEILALSKLLPKDHPVKGKILQILASISTRTNAKEEQMERRFKDILEMQALRLPKNSFEYKLHELKLANFYNEYGEQFRKAKETYDRIPYEEITKQIHPSHKLYPFYANYYANYFMNEDTPLKAQEVLEDAVSKITKANGDKDPALINLLNTLAKVYALEGQYLKAEKTINQSLEIANKNFPKKSPEYASTLSEMAALNGEIGNYYLAEKYLKKTNTLYRRLSRNKDVASEYNIEALKAESIENLAEIYTRIGEYDLTESLLLQNIAHKEEKYGENSRMLIKPLQQLSRLYNITGAYDEAEKYNMRSEEIINKTYGNESLYFADNKHILSTIRTSLGNFDRAIPDVDQSIQIQHDRLGKQHVRNAFSYNHKAKTLLLQDADKNLKQSEKLFQRSLSLIKKNLGDNHPRYAEALQNLAVIYVENKQYDKAIENLDQANQIWINKTGELNINSAQIYSMKGDIALKQNKSLEAEQDYRKAKDIHETLFDNTHPGYVKNLSKLGKVAYVNKNYAQAAESLSESLDAYLEHIHKFFPSLSEREKAEYWSSIRSDFEFFNALAAKQIKTNPELMGKVYDYTLATKAILLNSSIKIRKKILEGEDKKLKETYLKWINQKEYLAEVLAMSAEDRASNNINIVKIEADLGKLEKEMSKRSGIFDSYKNYTWKDVRASLKTNQAAIEIVRFRDFETNFTDSVMYLVLKVDQNPITTYPKAFLIKDGNQLESKMLAYYRNTMRFDKQNDLSYEAYWKPIEDLIGTKSQIFVSPDGVYNQISLPSIQINDNTYVVDKVDVSLVSNTKDLIKEGQSKNKKGKYEEDIILIGNPDFYTSKVDFETIGRLPGTAKEIEELSKLLLDQYWATTVFTDKDATEANVKKIESPKIFHIATHAFFAEDITRNEGLDALENEILNNPLLNSGLLLQGAGEIFKAKKPSFNSRDGVLTAFEVMNMNFDKTDLVVLSACETGLGRVQVGEGVYGLQRAFQVAGAKQLVMSLFKVNDDVTKKLMTAIYRGILAGKNISQAFREAQLEIKSEHPSPLLWGAFVLIGVE